MNVINYNKLYKAKQNKRNVIYDMSNIWLLRLLIFYNKDFINYVMKKYNDTEANLCLITTINNE